MAVVKDALLSVQQILNQCYDSTNKRLNTSISDYLNITNDGTKTTLAGLAGDYFRIGDAVTTAQSLDSEDDLLITGDGEVGGTFYISSSGLKGPTAADVRIASQRNNASPCEGINFRTRNTADSADTLRLSLSSKIDTAVWTWQNSTHAGVKLSAAESLDCAGTGANGWKIKNPKNAAASALSGTQKDVEIDIGGVPYHFTVYPTKA